jgi:hypothetical protein
MVQKAMFTDYRAITLSPDTKWFLVSLMVAADDNGNVKLDVKMLRTRVTAKAGQTGDDIQNWVNELVETEFITPYTVNGEQFASIAEWDIRDGLTFQYIEKTKKQGWSNPKPGSNRNEAEVDVNDEEPSVRKDKPKPKVRVPKSRRNNAQEAKPTVTRRIARKTGSESNRGVGEGDGRATSIEQPRRILRRPTVKVGTLAPNRPKPPALKKPQKRVQAAREASTQEDHAMAEVVRKLETLQSQFSFSPLTSRSRTQLLGTKRLRT